MAYQKIHYRSRCQYCGRTCAVGTAPTPSGAAPNTAPPSPSGKCQKSPNGQHYPVWEPC